MVGQVLASEINIGFEDIVNTQARKQSCAARASGRSGRQVRSSAPAHDALT